MESSPGPAAVHRDRLCLLVRSGGEQFGVPIANVLRLVRNRPVYPVPGSRAPLLGLAQVGGDPVAVVDLKRLIDGRAEVEDHGLILLVRCGLDAVASTIGLAIDEALGLLPMPPARTDVGDGAVVGETSFEERRVRVVEPERLARPYPSTAGPGPFGE
jgi:chemotaxis signal transduction protein